MVSRRVVNELYEHTTEGSPLRKFIIAKMSSSLSRNFDAELPKLSPPVLADMVQWLRFERRDAGWKQVRFSSEELKQFLVDEQVGFPSRGC